MEILCFDLDNTLIKSNPAHVKAHMMAFEKNNLRKPTKKQLISLFGLVNEKIIAELYPELTTKQQSKLVKDHDTFVIKETAKYAKVIPGAKQVLKALKPHYKIAILSNCKKKEIAALLKATSFDKNMFDIIIGNDEVKHPKPCPDEIFKAEKLLGIKKGYMIGDSIYDVKAGKKAGLKTISVLTGDHSRYKLNKEKPHKILKSVKELPKILIKTK